MMNIDIIIDSLYREGTPLRRILLEHSKAVARKALTLDSRLSALDSEFLQNSAMLHDIGIVFCNAPGIECYGTEPYICHGLLGAKYLREHCHEWGITPQEIEPYARVCERHTGAGLTKENIIEQNLPLPHQDFLPETMEEKLICYADKFFSKSSADLSAEKPLERVRRSMQKFGKDSVERFEELHELFQQLTVNS